MSTAVLSIGANLGDRLANLQGAVDLHRDWLVAVSPIYETAPWGPVAQDDYLNAVLVAEDQAASPQLWLKRAHAAEAAAGRRRGVRFGPRTLDVDVISVDDVVSENAELTLPHPRAAERAFVLIPWLAAQPDASLAGVALTDRVAALSAAEVAGVRLRTDLTVH